MARYLFETLSRPNLEIRLEELKKTRPQSFPDNNFLLDELNSLISGGTPKGDNSCKEFFHRKEVYAVSESYVASFSTEDLEKYISGLEKDIGNKDLIDAIRRAEPRRELIIEKLKNMGN